MTAVHAILAGPLPLPFSLSFSFSSITMFGYYWECIELFPRVCRKRLIALRYRRSWLRSGRHEMGISGRKACEIGSRGRLLLPLRRRVLRMAIVGAVMICLHDGG